jgi:hypothetical protein
MNEHMTLIAALGSAIGMARECRVSKTVVGAVLRGLNFGAAAGVCPRAPLTECAGSSR